KKKGEKEGKRRGGGKEEEEERGEKRRERRERKVWGWRKKRERKIRKVSGGRLKGLIGSIGVKKILFGVVGGMEENGGKLKERKRIGNVKYGKRKNKKEFI
ncbi:hypothetical protein, partial [Acetobacter fabarum]|uniref:hypothetical protein n=1 Tax=Acetobacter fabarum TaxID=483199 RepID=UPI0015CF340B